MTFQKELLQSTMEPLYRKSLMNIGKLKNIIAFALFMAALLANINPGQSYAHTCCDCELTSSFEEENEVMSINCFSINNYAIYCIGCTRQLAPKLFRYFFRLLRPPIT